MNFPFILNMTSVQESSSFIWIIGKRCFPQEESKRILTYLNTILKDSLLHPEKKINELEIVPLEEKQQLLHDFNDTEADTRGIK